MSKVLSIGIAKLKGGKILSVNNVNAIAGKGLLDDRKFKDNNDKKSQITLIEIENIASFNHKNKSDISPFDFSNL